MVLAQSVLRFSTQGAFVVIKWARNRRHIEGFSSFSRDAPSHLHNIDVHGKQHSVHIDSCIDSNNAQRPWIINITQGLNEDGVAISSRCSEQHYLSRSLEKLHIAANGKYVIDLGSFFFFFFFVNSVFTHSALSLCANNFITMLLKKIDAHRPLTKVIGLWPQTQPQHQDHIIVLIN